LTAVDAQKRDLARDVIVLLTLTSCRKCRSWDAGKLTMTPSMTKTVVVTAQN